MDTASTYPKTTNNASAQASSNMRMAVTALMTLSTVFQLIALVSNHWISGNGRQEILYLGIWKGCSIYECGDQTGGEYVKASLVVSFIVSVILSGIFLLHYWVDFSDVSNFKICMGKMVLAMTFFQASGMVYASIFFILSLYYGGLRYAYFMGWIGVILSVAAGVLSYYHGKIEPEEQATPNTVQNMTGATPENPPPYSVMP